MSKQTYENWVHALAQCTRRIRSSTGYNYCGLDNHHHSHNCSCDKCKQWQKANDLHDYHRQTEGLPT